VDASLGSRSARPNWVSTPGDAASIEASMVIVAGDPGAAD
jgi:hypothetical protein